MSDAEPPAAPETQSTGADPAAAAAAAAPAASPIVSTVDASASPAESPIVSTVDVPASPIVSTVDAPASPAASPIVSSVDPGPAPAEPVTSAWAPSSGPYAADQLQPSASDGGSSLADGLSALSSTAAATVEQRPEVLVGAAFAGGFLLAMILRRLAA